MLDDLTLVLKEQGILSGKLPKMLTRIADAIPNQEIPYRMKLTIAASEMILYSSHFRRNIAHWNGSMIPPNVIAFSLAKSGAGKDSSVSAARKCFKSGYSLIDEKREALAVASAIQEAARNPDIDDPNAVEAYSQYLKRPEDLFASPDSSIKGLMGHFNQLEDNKLGAGFIYSGEFGSELESSKTMEELIRFISEAYDEGNKEVKLIGNKEEQMKSIKNFPVSALLLGSQDNILYDENVKRKFRKEFNTKLARRSFFNYSPEEVSAPTFDHLEGSARVLAAIEHDMKVEDDAKNIRLIIDSEIEELTRTALGNIGIPMQVGEGVRETFTLYTRYNKAKSATILKLYPISKLVREHLQWKAFKMAGAIAFFNSHEEITKEDYIQAISFVELLDKDMGAFETELVKEPYELFVKYMHSIEEDGKAFIGLHELRKMGYIPTTGKPEARLKELVELATSYDQSGIHTVSDGGVSFEKIIKTNASGVSYVSVSGDKSNRAKQCAVGYTYGEFTFEALAGMLQDDYAYSPFKFTDGKRGSDYIEGGCKWVCLDVDKSSITDVECHQILQNFNHHVVRTSDKDNEFKFRVLLELDSIADVPDKIWKPFIKSIAEYLSLEVDSLPKSQIFFSYSDREILSVTDKNTIEVREHLLYAHNIGNENMTDYSKLTKAQRSSMLDNRRDTFDIAFESEDGEGSINLIAAARKAKRLGADREEVLELVNEINDYWTQSMPPDRFKATITNQIERWSW